MRTKNFIPNYTIYTDGSGKANDKFPGGWSFCVCDSTDEVIHYESGYEDKTSTQRMELRAGINAIKYIKKMNLEKCLILTDSQYFEKGINEWMEIWKLNNFISTKNDDLWREINKLIFKDNVKFNIGWIRGHTGIWQNEFVDKLAGEARINRVNELKEIYE